MSGADPTVEPRGLGAIQTAVREKIGGYVPGWRPRPGSAGAAMLEVFSRYLALFAAGLNQVPGRSRLAFLDMLGTGLLRARSARAPLVFTLLEESPDDATVPANTRVAAPAAPAPASPLSTDDENDASGEAVVFATTQSISVVRAGLAAVYSLDPPNDLVADHGDSLTTGFALFDDMEAVDHALYLGHDEHFGISGPAVVRLSVRTAAYPPSSVRQGLEVAWSYLAEAGWIPLTLVEDGTEGFTRSGEIVLESACGPDAVAETIDGHESFWIRGLLESELVPEGAGGEGRLPAIDRIEARVEFAKEELQPDAAFADTVPLDTSNRFFPFGRRPERHATFYIACEEAFSRANASIEIRFWLVSRVETSHEDLALSWSYFDGEEWADLEDFSFDDDTDLLREGAGTAGRAVSFRCPEDWAANEVNGTEGFWLRVRLDEGDYGEAMRLEVDTTTGDVTLVDQTYDPPVVEKVRLSYTYRTDPTLVDRCVTENNAVQADHGEDCRWPRRLFEPFVPVDELQPAVHFGFDRALPSGLVSLYLHTTPDEVTGDESGLAPPYVWEYLAETGWTELSVLDETAGFRASGLIQFVGPSDAAATEGRGGELYRVRARLKRGESAEATAVDGLWLNAVWATHREYVEGDVLGSSDGNPDQSFGFLRATASILEGETVEVREWSDSGGDWETVAEGLDDADVRLETDSASGEVTAVWVRWHRVDHLFDSGAEDRHYTLERAEGMLRFGDGVHGMIPPAGAQVVATYDSGGGVAGNVEAGAISELRAGVAYLESVGNPVAAAGGAEVEATERVADRGPQRLRHRDRAVTAEDFEWLAREASPAVYHARCRPLAGPAGFAQRGWVTLLIAPDSPEPQPGPTAELRRQVLSHCSARCPAAIASQILVTGPEYVAVSVLCEIVPVEPDDAAVVEAQARANLDAFLHPITGGPEGRGWSFGESLYLSQIARVLEIETEGVDYVAKLGLTADGVWVAERVPVAEDRLISAAEHEIKISLGED